MLDCLVNGVLSRFVPADDRGFTYGDGLFETLCVVRGVPRFWSEHMERLARGCERLGIAMPREPLLLAEVKTACAGQDRAVARIVVTRGAGGRGYAPGDAGPALRVVSSHPWPEGVEEQARRGLRVRLCETRLGLQPALGGIKHLNRLEQVLAARELEGSDDEEGILLDRDGHVVGGISCNLFLVAGQRLLTPRMDRCGVRGVVRGMILQDFKSRCELRRITVDMLPEANELFLCNSVRGILPVTRLDGKPFPSGAVTAELREWFGQQAGEA